MGIKIKKRKWKNRDGSFSESWRLLVEDYSSGERKCLYPAKKDYLKYGLDPLDSFERAKEKTSVIQAKNRIQRTAQRRARIEKRIQQEDLKESAYLPREIYSQFLDWLRDRRMWDQIPPKSESHLRCMRKIVLEMGECPSNWPDKPEKIFLWFRKNKLSLSYIEKVLPLLNDYGYFYCKAFKKPYLKIPHPKSDVARRIEDANLEARDGEGSESKPISPAHLEKLADLSEARLRWVRLSVYFGLRPHEIDDLAGKPGKVWEIRTDPKGTPILRVYQRKLIKVSRDRRWKRIPCILPEQVELIEELRRALPLERPSVKQIENRLGEGHYLYGGRKGFEKLMREKDQDFVNVSRWLGHLDIRRTEWNYRELEAVEYSPVVDKKAPNPSQQSALDDQAPSSEASPSESVHAQQI